MNGLLRLCVPCCTTRWLRCLGLDEPPPFVHVVAAGFLDIDVFARLARQDGRRGVPVVPGGNHHGIHRFVVQDAPQVGDRVLGAGLLLRLAAPRLVRVAHVGNVGQAGELLSQSRARGRRTR